MESHRIIFEEEVTRFQEACNFDGFSALVKTQVESIIRDVSVNPDPLQKIYGCGIWLDLEQSCLGFFISRLGPFEAELKSRQAKRPELYSDDLAILRFKYYEYSTEYYDPDSELQECLNLHKGLYEQFFEKFDEECPTAVREVYGKMFQTAVSEVLVQLKPKWMELDTTNDFVTYITLYDSGYDEEYQALLLTMSRAEADNIIPVIL